MIVVMSSPRRIEHLAGQLLAQGMARGKGLMLGPRTTSTVSPGAAGGAIMLSLMGKLSGVRVGGTSSKVRGVGDVAGEGGYRRGLRAAQIHLAEGVRCGRRSCGKGAQGHGIGGRSLAHADAGAAARLQNAGAGVDHGLQRPVAASMDSTCREPGEMVKLTQGAMLCP